MVGFIVAQTGSRRDRAVRPARAVAADRGARHASTTACSSRRIGGCARSGSRRPAKPAESERTKITVFTLIGQVVYFRIGREAVMRRMGWTTIGPDKAAAAVIVSPRTISRAILAARKGSKAMSFLCSIPLIASLFSAVRGPAAARRRLCRGRLCASGADRGRQVETIAVRRGDRVEAGDADRRHWKTATPTIAVAQAEAALAQAEAQLADLQVGKRPEEIAVLEATLRFGARRRADGGRARARRGIPIC